MASLHSTVAIVTALYSGDVIPLSHSHPLINCQATLTLDNHGGKGRAFLAPLPIMPDFLKLQIELMNESLVQSLVLVGAVYTLPSYLSVAR